MWGRLAVENWVLFFAVQEWTHGPQIRFFVFNSSLSLQKKERKDMAPKATTMLDCISESTSLILVPVCFFGLSELHPYLSWSPSRAPVCAFLFISDLA